ncbi:uncharacterized protein M421DRAFT_315536 [Didymella exigua CBS 183.55]|uniref:Uncharacterized protein n=1 Tax=Didymella exigua CBS 183.55 TaxID=1150837 RepID=A0A6A5RUN7_9PLEO|nr:uncharacterized protein M421DRAFT_315536 [Didymella exigua CBS 183.55]KAF1931572.1 hypothetical protein M421DRAFT_315536 [Didymella exigua CBS 183.55]
MAEHVLPIGRSRVESVLARPNRRHRSSVHSFLRRLPTALCLQLATCALVYPSADHLNRAKNCFLHHSVVSANLHVNMHSRERQDTCARLSRVQEQRVQVRFDGTLVSNLD